MKTFQGTRESLTIVLLTSNAVLKAGMEAMLGRPVMADISGERLPAGRGVLLLDVAGCTPAQRVRMLGLIQGMRHAPDWRALALVDAHDAGAAQLARVAGIPRVSLKLPLSELHAEVTGLLRTRQTLRADSVAGVTSRQWGVIRDTLSRHSGCHGRLSSSEYGHRMMGLRRMRLKSMHELRCLIAQA